MAGPVLTAVMAIAQESLAELVYGESWVVELMELVLAGDQGLAVSVCGETVSGLMVKVMLELAGGGGGGGGGDCSGLEEPLGLEWEAGRGPDCSSDSSLAGKLPESGPCI